MSELDSDITLSRVRPPELPANFLSRHHLFELIDDDAYTRDKLYFNQAYRDVKAEVIFLTHNATIFVKEPPKTESGNSLQLIIIPIVIVIAIVIYMIRRNKKLKIQAN